MGEHSDASYDIWARGTRFFRWLSDTITKPRSIWVSTALLLFIVVAFIAAFMSDHGITSIFNGGSLQNAFSAKYPKTLSNNIIPFNCTAGNMTEACLEDFPATSDNENSSAEACPEYFRWIHEDLRPWSYTGISREMIEASAKYGDFRLVSIKGKVYVEKYRGVFQTRDVFTIWGILQLVKLYPGKLGDFDILFACGDVPMVLKGEHQSENDMSPPPVFHYCKDEFSWDIVFPDWSFWGWPEINIKPWVTLSEELEEGNNKTRWMEREPYAYWKGNKMVSRARRALFKCNPTPDMDWNARIFNQDWSLESSQGFNNSNLANQCTHRYKIYIEGVGWSVSQKYILACDSMTLLITPRYYDIFTRGLIPLKHYWPIRKRKKGECKSIKFAVDWGNKNPQKAQEIGKEGSKFILESSKMSHVYDYMLHLLNEYSRLLKYEPTIPPKAVEISSETELINNAWGLLKTYKMESMVKEASITSPCSMPPPYDPPTLRRFLERKEKRIKQVEFWEVDGNVN